MYGFTVNCSGDAVEQLRKIDEALKQAGVNAKVQVGEIENHFAGMGEKIKGVFSDLKGLLAGGIIAGGVFGGFEFIKSSREAYDALEKSVTRVNTVLNSTKYAAGLSGSAVEDQAKELSRGIVASRSEIMDAQGMLLSFTGIKGPIFSQTTKAVSDFATFYKEDMTTAALQIGKALNNPLIGMNRLQRQGVAFTDEQKKQIKNFQEQGDLLDAQRVILKELHTEFGGQAVAFAKTDEGKKMMDEKGWEDLKLEIGEIVSKLQLSLLPVFAQIRGYVKEAFESGPVQFFIGHIKDLLSIGLKIIPMWVIYKGIMMSTSLITSIFSISNGILTTSLGSLTVMTDGATVAVEGFSAAMSATGIGAIAIGLGLIIEKFISMNKEIDDAIDKLGNLKENSNFMSQSDTKFHDLANRFAIINKLSKTDKEQLYDDLKTQKESLEAQKSKIMGSLNAYQQSSASANKVVGEHYENQGQGQHVRIVDYAENNSFKRDALKQAVLTTTEQLKDVNRQLGAIDGGFKKLSNYGVKHGAAGYKPAGTGIKGNAYSTSELAGAKGGLGEAKVVNIHIDTVQKIDGVLPEGIKNNAQSAIEILIRTINNMAYSQSGTM